MNLEQIGVRESKNTSISTEQFLFFSFVVNILIMYVKYIAAD